ncbi:flavin reductase family protein [Halorubrum sp. JWXQ-INN 858]|uniref:flavin reductase family protein n=1 Tax=Halorubrum sp. JWXQ-INN 858 TaxID=2690782 RepID=UPI00135C03B4|nr:flavin reductase family protein [Halorubrum sp. JWXQ-INN 858]MWV64100.1 flavin reductase family protein [Halorubrum sp. JWXQ-INN 858]
MPELSADTLDRDENARLIKTAVTPRPIAWISTVDADGNENLAPFSSYNYVGSSQPVLVFNSPSEASGRMKDTARNAVDTEEFAVNVVTEAFIERMDRTSERLAPDESEFEAAGVERADCRHIDPPRVADAVVTMECTLYDAIEVYDKVMILGDVRHYHVDEDVLTDGKIDSRKVDTVGRLGGPYYTVSEPLEFERGF